MNEKTNGSYKVKKSNELFFTIYGDIFWQRNVNYREQNWKENKNSVKMQTKWTISHRSTQNRTQFLKRTENSTIH